jgi:hypothetical protein
MMILPPYSLPFGGQIPYINTAKLNHILQQRTCSSKHRSSSKHNNTNQQKQTVKINS